MYFADPIDAGRLTLLTRFQTEKDSLIGDTVGVSIRHYAISAGRSILLVAVHLPSKLRLKTEDQLLLCTETAALIRDAEERVQHDRTIVIGDFNMNPFEAGLVGSSGFHAIMDRSIAETRSRLVNGREYLFFYNPMWSMLGESPLRPPGTYYFNSGTPVNYYWHLFDQVLLRPSLLPHMPHSFVKVVTEVCGTSLLNESGRPNKTLASDHLPVVCELKEVVE